VSALAASDRRDRERLLKLLEERRRRLARDDLNAYCRYIEIPGAPINDEDPDCAEFYRDTVTPAEHHQLINRTLMRVEAGEMRRIMIFMPPGSAKSTYGTVTFPTWFMGRKRGRHVITTSYGADLARKFGRKCRQIARSKEYREVFGTGLVSDNKAADDWALDSGSSFMAAGIDAGITGNRADGIVIDDPLKGRQDADSETIRNRIWEEYKASVRTRLKPGGFILIIQTRWHEDDIAGRILPKDWDGESGWVTAQDGEKWYVLCLQAQCERQDDPLGREIGEWLWTDWFTPEHWEQERRTQGSRNWAALYQQKPAPDDGGLWKLSWFGRYKGLPEDRIMVVQSWDTANKAAEINDPSVCTTWIVSRRGKFIAHVLRERMEYPALRRTAIAHAKAWNPDAVLIEDKASGQQLIQDLKDTTSLPVIAIEPEGDKVTRASVVSPTIESGQVYLPEEADWLLDYEMEVGRFPLSKHKDQVDSTSQALRWMQDRVSITGVATSGDQRVGYGAGASTSSGSAFGFGSIGGGTDTSGFIV
jgi:predicted phage terminase large subunit-like protein